MGNRRVVRWSRGAELRFAETVSMLLTATLTVSETLNAASRMRSLGVGREVAELAADANAAGFAIADVLQAHLRRMEPLHAAMWQAFDETGATEPLVRLAKLMRTWIALQQKIVTALIYPACVLTLMTAGVGALVFFVLPAAVTTSGVFGADGASRLEQAGDAGRVYLWAVGAVGSLGLLFALAAALRRSDATAVRWIRTASDRVSTTLPLIRRLTRLRALFCLASTASAVCEGGGTIDEALDCGVAAIPDGALRIRFAEAVGSVRVGSDLSSAFARLLGDSGTFVRWFELIDHGSDPAVTFAGLVAHLQASLDLWASRITAAAEPVTIGVAGIVMIVVVATVIMPLIHMYAGLIP